MSHEKYSYVQGFCNLLHYNGLWCVKYMCTTGHYYKVNMACSCSSENCDKECQVLEKAPDVIDISQ